MASKWNIFGQPNQEETEEFASKRLARKKRKDARDKEREDEELTRKYRVPKNVQQALDDQMFQFGGTKGGRGEDLVDGKHPLTVLHDNIAFNKDAMDDNRRRLTEKGRETIATLENEAYNQDANQAHFNQAAMSAHEAVENLKNKVYADVKEAGKDEEKALKEQDTVNRVIDAENKINEETKNATASDSFRSKTNEALAGLLPMLMGGIAGGLVSGKEGILEGASVATDLQQAQQTAQAQAEQAQAQEQLAAQREDRKWRREQGGKVQLRTLDLEAEEAKLRDQREWDKSMEMLKLSSQEKKDAKMAFALWHKAAPKSAEILARAPATIGNVNNVISKIESLDESYFGKIDSTILKWKEKFAGRDVRTLNNREMRTTLDQQVLGIIKDITGAQMTDAEREFIMGTIYQDTWSKDTLLRAWKAFKEKNVTTNAGHFKAAAAFGSKLPAQSYFLSVDKPNVVSKLKTDKTLQDRTQADIISELKTKYGLDDFAIRTYILGDLFTLMVDDETGLFDLVPKKKDK